MLAVAGISKFFDFAHKMRREFSEQAEKQKNKALGITLDEALGDLNAWHELFRYDFKAVHIGNYGNRIFYTLKQIAKDIDNKSESLTHDEVLGALKFIDKYRQNLEYCLSQKETGEKNGRKMQSILDDSMILEDRILSAILLKFFNIFPKPQADLFVARAGLNNSSLIDRLRAFDNALIRQDIDTGVGSGPV